jgi:hypothetical protein
VDHPIDDDPTPSGGWDEVRCPQCSVVVQPTWDWCHGCGYDPDGLREAGHEAAEHLGEGIPDDDVPPPPPPPPPPSAAPPPPSGDAPTRGGLLGRRRNRT